ncbi:uncharacterized protein [Epargyreus clarus]|uniref:uncharacterized protein n=1 Tax=Epargyreus clarus TaxID=520877 RepID=UPI003C30971E
MQRKVVKPNKIETLKQSVKTVSKEYCAESSICGLKHLVDENTPCIERVIWIITLIGALIFSVTLVWITFRKYYRAPLVTTQMPEGVFVSNIIFPAVGICTNNRISKQAVTNLARKLLKEERNSKYNEKEMLSLLFGLGMLYNFQPINDKSVQPMQLHRALGDYDVNELMRSLTPSCEDLLLRCSWNEKPMNCSDLFDFRLTMNGYCCTFNYLRESDITFIKDNAGSRGTDMYKYGNKSTFDFDQGLKVLMRLNESDDFYYNMPLQGAQLQFSDAYDFPDAPSGSFAMQIISPNVQMTVLVTASFTEASRDIQHIPVKLRQCLFYDESPYLPFYTHSDCLLKCRMLFLFENCNCTPFNMPKMVNMRTCDMRDMPCLRIFNIQSMTVRPPVDPIPPELEMHLAGGGIRCPMCYPSCSKTAYNYDFNNVNIYSDYLNSISDKDRIDWLQGANFTGTSIVHVKYAREVADRYGQNVIMKWFDLISNIGSTCGFITGFSFVSVLEFIYFYTVKLVREISTRRRAQSPVGNAFESTSPLHFEPMSKYRSIYWNELAGPRFFWLILVVLSWYGSSLLIAAQYDAFLNNPISFVVETTYKDWNTNFPAVAVCEHDNMASVEEVADGLWGPGHDLSMDEVLKELTYYKGVTYYSSLFCGGENPMSECFQSNLTFYANLIRSSCHEILQNCSWNDKIFDCCKYFRPMDTELGSCYVVNSIQGRERNPPRIQMVSNRTLGPGMIKFSVLVPSKVYVLNEEDVPSLTTLGSDVITIEPQVSFRKDAQMRLCNCTNFFMPNVPEHIKCNISGIICLNEHVDNWSILKARWSPRRGIYCDCLPSCTEAELSNVKDFQDLSSMEYGVVQIGLAVLPNERYRRNVVRGILDLVVSTGGTGGLFLGASILSFVELLYILLIRPFCDIYSQRGDDPWHRKYGTRRLEDNKFVRKHLNK